MWYQIERVIAAPACGRRGPSGEARRGSRAPRGRARHGRIRPRVCALPGPRCSHRSRDGGHTDREPGRKTSGEAPAGWTRTAGSEQPPGERALGRPQRPSIGLSRRADLHRPAQHPRIPRAPRPHRRRQRSQHRLPGAARRRVAVPALRARAHDQRLRGRPRPCGEAQPRDARLRAARSLRRARATR